MTRTVSAFLLALLSLTFLPSAGAQRPADDWTRLLERREGWLAADGIYTVDLTRDAQTGLADPDAAPKELFIFSDSFGGTTRDDGREFDKVVMTNHAFGILRASNPDYDAIDFVWHDPNDVKAPGERVRNVVEGRYWLQDGIRYGDRLWLTAIKVGDGWKPDRIDALTFPLDPQTGVPDFSRPTLDTNAPLSLKRDDAQIVLGAAIDDEADDGYIYVYGYLDHLKGLNSKDAIVARVPREKFEDYGAWEYYDGRGWSDRLDALFDPDAALARGVSTEYSVSRIPVGAAKGKLLLVYTPGTISERVAFRVGETPWGPFGDETVFYRSSVPQDMPGIRCYNAKAHPIFSDDRGVLVSYNINRLWDTAKKPSEYRPQFIWLDWETIDAAVAGSAGNDAERP